MSSRNQRSRTIPAAARACRSSLLLFLLLPTLMLIGCENPHEPVEPAQRPPAAAGDSDSHTLLLLRFNDSFAGYAGEQPSQTSGVTFQPGVLGSGALVNGTDRLAYATAGNLLARAGTVELWIRPRWNETTTSTITSSQCRGPCAS